jgi:hypothetical protein
MGAEGALGIEGTMGAEGALGIEGTLGTEGNAKKAATGNRSDGVLRFKLSGISQWPTAVLHPQNLTLGPRGNLNLWFELHSNGVRFTTIS